MENRTIVHYSLEIWLINFNLKESRSIFSHIDLKIVFSNLYKFKEDFQLIEKYFYDEQFLKYKVNF